MRQQIDIDKDIMRDKFEKMKEEQNTAAYIASLKS